MANKVRNSLIAGGVTLSAAVMVIGSHEGSSNEAIKPVPTDPWTICYGDTNNVSKGDYQTDAQCRERFAKALPKYNVPYEKLGFDLTPAQHVAFLDTTYNIGVGATMSSSFYKLLRTGKVNQACDHLTDWKYVAGHDCSKGTYCRGIWTRRVQMKAVCKGEIPLEVVLKGINYNYGEEYIPDMAAEK